MTYTRENADFESRETRCAAWLYRPEGDERNDPPIVVMGHGFGGTRRMGLPAYAERFANRGLAVLVFDYRGFGDSDGRHRNIVDPTRHLEDWRAAVDHARGLADVDGNRVGVWGTSFSGGHALVTAAREDVDAYVGQVPYYGNAPSPVDVFMAYGTRYVVGMLGATIRDLIRDWTFRSPYYVPIVAEPGELAPLNQPGAASGYRSIVPDDLDEETWNRCAARIFLSVGAYEPREYAADIDCPAFVFQANRDRLVSADAIEQVVDRLDDVERVREECGHFDPYTGELFEDLVDRQADFLVQHLG